MAEALAKMLPVARAGQSAAERVGPLKSAEQWLKNCEKNIRDERFETVKERVKGSLGQTRCQARTSFSRT